MDYGTILCNITKVINLHKEDKIKGIAEIIELICRIHSNVHFVVKKATKHHFVMNLKLYFTTCSVQSSQKATAFDLPSSSVCQ